MDLIFQIDRDDRMELTVRGSEYGILAIGMLSFQGTRYLGCERETEG